MKIIQITDIHLQTKPAVQPRRDPVERLIGAFRDIIKRHSDAELIVITGDLVEDGSEEGYRMLSDMIADTEMPVELMIGNHDDRANFLKVFPDRANESGFVQSMQELSAGRALFLDTHETGHHDGVLCERRLAWLEAQLAAQSGPFWIFMHHNPIPTHLPLIDRIMLRDPDHFAQIVEANRDRIAHIFHGHLHLPMSGSLHGVPLSCPRGTAHAGYPNYGDSRLLPHSNLPSSYSVIIADGPATTVMMVEYGAEPVVEIKPVEKVAIA